MHNGKVLKAGGPCGVNEVESSLRGAVGVGWRQSLTNSI